MKNKTTKLFFTETLLTMLLISGGVVTFSTNRMYEKVYQILYMFSALWVFLGLIIGLINVTDWHFRIEIIIYMIILIDANILFWIVNNNQKSLLEFKHKTKNMNCTSQEAFLFCENYFKIFFIIIMTLLCGYYFFYVIGSLVVTFLIGNLNNPMGYVIPGVYACATSKLHDNHQSWTSVLCWNIDSYAKYVTINIFECIFLWIIAFPLVMTFMFYIFTLVYVKTNQQFIKENIASICRSNIFFLEKNDFSKVKFAEENVQYSNDLDARLCHRFNKIMQHHQITIQ